ncbi:hypothetical protein HDU97_002140 [Phlyctochytrium planicorne]|nr:hypothetical protein HDU97_002140 [Phlyctochytrium planicorne]
MSLGRLSRLPKEIFTEVLKLIEDWKIALTLECIYSNIPNTYKTAAKAMESAGIAAKVLATRHLLSRLIELSGKMTFLQISFIRTFLPTRLPTDILRDNLDSIKILQYIQLFLQEGIQGSFNAIHGAAKSGRPEMLETPQH